MANYLIHTYPKRLWYVEEYLIPSLITQGIEKSQISVYNDNKCEGNLRACMRAFLSVPFDDKGTWHLQDDICICKRFRELTELYDTGLVCGFSSEMYDGPGNIGAVKTKNMWFSFPCIRIPNAYAVDCANWTLREIIGNMVYKDYWINGKNDDWAFRAYIKSFHKEDMALNLAPNLVDHVDYLLGGGTGANKREKPCRAQYWWEDDTSVEELEATIKSSPHYKE